MNLNLDEMIEKYGLEKINSMTKYPSILTYHKIGDKGILQPELTDGTKFDEEVYVTEKVDGTNTRIIVSGCDYIIGSREDLLYAKGDRIINHSMSIVDTVKSIADRVNIFGGQVS